MSTAASASAIERFRSLVAQRLGLRFDEDKFEWLGSVLQKHANAHANTLSSSDPAQYLDSLASSSPASTEWTCLVPELTVAETYFFRNIEQFNALREEVMPRRLATRLSSRALRCLSAGCASGEEAYSIAMTLAPATLEAGVSVTVQAVDLNPANITKARSGRYGNWSLRETPPDMRQRWFRPDGKEHLLDERIRQAVSFEARNLMDEDEALWRPDFYDVVFCRNVLMYFVPAHLQAVLARITRSLVPGGYLFLGHAESLRGLSRDFHLRHTHGTFYYQRKSASEVAAGDAAGDAASDAAIDATGARLSAGRPAAISSHDWVQTIGHAADRVRVLTSPPIHTGKQVPHSTNTQPHSKAFDRAFELFRQERFSEALSMVSDLQMGVAHLPEMRLLHAVLLVHSGLLAQAEALCMQLLRNDEMDANAHHLLALCREGVGDHVGAIDSDQTAAYLDPAFAMPHLHLGLLARRQGDRAMVRKELSLALRLLSREDATRLQLFGGGFNRHTLATLCAAELATDGAA